MSWTSSTLGELINLNYGKGLPEIKRVEGDVPVYGSGGIIGFHKEALIEGPGIIVGRKGTVGSVYWEGRNFFPIDTSYYVTPKSGKSNLKILNLFITY
jgi:type I restriction enzyme S subunit